MLARLRGLEPYEWAAGVAHVLYVVAAVNLLIAGISVFVPFSLALNPWVIAGVTAILATGLGYWGQQQYLDQNDTDDGGEG